MPRSTPRASLWSFRARIANGQSIARRITVLVAVVIGIALTAQAEPAGFATHQAFIELVYTSGQLRPGAEHRPE